MHPSHTHTRTRSHTHTHTWESHGIEARNLKPHSKILALCRLPSARS